jgi:hypothetical protein
MTERRDPEIGAILDELDVIEHGSGYWEAVLNAAEPELARLRVGATETGGIGGAAAPRQAAERRRPIAALIERYPTFGGGFRFPVWAGIALVAVIVAVMLVGLPRGGGNGVTGPQPATAAEAIRLSLDVLSDAQVIAGTSRTYDNGFTENGETVLSRADTLVATRDGSIRIESIPGEEAYYPGTCFGVDAKVIVVYDAASRRYQYLLDAGPDGTVSSVEAIAEGKRARYDWCEKLHVAAGPPDSPEALDDVPFLRLRAYLRTLLSAPGVELEVRSVDGRPSWIVTAPWVVGSETYRARIAIDATTRLPYEVEYRLGHRVIRMQLDMAVRDSPVDSSRFTIPEPPAEETQRGFMPSDFSLAGDTVSAFWDLLLDDPGVAGRRIDNMPALPAWVPVGYELTDATASKVGPVASLVYRRGFDQITVTTRPDSRLHRSSWSSVEGSAPVRTDTSNPFIPRMHPRTRPAWDAQTIRVRLTAGAFAGQTARVITDPQLWPHLWVKKDGIVATVAGDVTVRQMVRIAESLGPWPGDDDK